MQKQKLLFEQSRLCNRGAAEMALMYISASNGQLVSFHWPQQGQGALVPLEVFCVLAVTFNTCVSRATTKKGRKIFFNQPPLTNHLGQLNLASFRGR